MGNFKGIKTAKIDVGRITVLIGPNGTGKSSISQALMMLKQSIGQQELTCGGNLINIGNFNDVLNRNSADKRISLGIAVGLTDYDKEGIPKNSSFSYIATFDPKLYSFEGEISTPRKKLFTVKMDPNGTTIEPQKYHWEFEPSRHISINLSRGKTIATPFVAGSSSSSAGFEKKAEATSNVLKQIFSELNNALNRVFYVPAIRGLDNPSYALATQPNLNILAGQNMELVSTFALADEDIKELVAIWAESVIGSELTPTLLPNRMVTVKSSAVKRGIPVTVDGSGTNQLVHLLLILASTPTKSIIAIEEPEIHLHPSAQEKLCDLLLEIAKKFNKQLIITTHSEHILYAFVSAVKSNRLAKDELSIFYFEEKDKEPYRVEQDDYGDIYDWGKNFFSMP